MRAVFAYLLIVGGLGAAVGAGVGCVAGGPLAGAAVGCVLSGGMSRLCKGIRPRLVDNIGDAVAGAIGAAVGSLAGTPLLGVPVGFVVGAVGWFMIAAFVLERFFPKRSRR